MGWLTFTSAGRWEVLPQKEQTSICVVFAYRVRLGAPAVDVRDDARIRVREHHIDGVNAGLALPLRGERRHTCAELDSGNRSSRFFNCIWWRGATIEYIWATSATT